MNTRRAKIAKCQIETLFVQIKNKMFQFIFIMIMNQLLCNECGGKG